MEMTSQQIWRVRSMNSPPPPRYPTQRANWWPVKVSSDELCNMPNMAIVKNSPRPFWYLGYYIINGYFCWSPIKTPLIGRRVLSDCEFNGFMLHLCCLSEAGFCRSWWTPGLALATEVHLDGLTKAISTCPSVHSVSHLNLAVTSVQSHVPCVCMPVKEI